MSDLKAKAKKTLSLKLPPALDRELKTLAKRRSVAKSALVREALSSYLSTVPRSARGSFLSLAGDLAGCVEGAPDLSMSAEHLKGYGR